ncbi:MAG: glutamyl-tRNA reductase [Pseudomonadales bacterium]|nr:glutamyl-tRNA reductase [Pseudomonadales bacterium]
MDLMVVGINHNTAPVSLREKIAFTPDQLAHALPDLKASADLQELAILSTCNRTEIYAVHGHNEPEAIIRWLTDYHQLSEQTLRESIYTYWGHSSVKHVMRVAAGLDSMVLGEPQILGQLKDCFNYAQNHNTMGTELNRLSQNTYRVAKQVRSNTAIGQNPVSVASTSVVLASQLFADLSTCNALLLGAGETIELVARHLKNAGIRQMVIANRTLANAEKLAMEVGGLGTDLADIPNQLAGADIVIASTGSELPILGKGTVERALKQRRYKPIFMVDLAVPRDIEPEVDELRDVYLYSVDDLQAIIADNLSSREEAAEEAELMVEHAVQEFQRSHKSRDAVDVLVRFRKKHEAIKQAELARAIARLQKGEDAEKVLGSFANQLTNKIIHTPSIQLKQAGAEGRDDIFTALEDLFQLGDEDQDTE